MGGQAGAFCFPDLAAGMERRMTAEPCQPHCRGAVRAGHELPVCTKRGNLWIFQRFKMPVFLHVQEREEKEEELMAQLGSLSLFPDSSISIYPLISLLLFCTLVCIALPSACFRKGDDSAGIT